MRWRPAKKYCSLTVSQSLAELAKHMVDNGPRKTLETSRRVRVIHNHTFIVDTTKSVLVWEHNYFPQFYVSQDDLQNCKLNDKYEIHSGGQVAAAVVELTIPAHDGIEEAKTDRAIRFADSKGLGPLAGMVRLEFGSMGKLPAVLEQAESFIGR